MKLRTKFPFYTSISVLTIITVITVYSIFSYRQSALENIERFKQEEIEKIKAHLKDVVDIAYEMISVTYQNSKDVELIEKLAQGWGARSDSTINKDEIYKQVSDYILNLTLENLRVLRYSGDGYIWINNVNKPYRVVMHPINPELEGQKLDGPEFNLVKGSKQNIYAYFAEIVQKNGEGYSEYQWYKPGERELMPKISYLRLFEQLGWVVGTGVYVDNIDKIVNRKKKELNNQINRMILVISLLGLVLTSIAVVILRRFANNLTLALYDIIDQLNEMAKGKSVQKQIQLRDDEIGEMQFAMGIFIDGVSTYNLFAQEIGKDNLEAKFSPLSEADNLGNSLIEMRNSLRSAKQEESKRQTEDAKRNWATGGFARFGEILRESSDSLEQLADNVIRNLVRYLSANQGGFFTLQTPEKGKEYLQLTAAFAYDHKKYLEKRIELREGLVGTCAVEKKTIYMTDVPEGYMEITSGLGEATPSYLLIVPLKIENKLHGIIEIASFYEFQPHQISFVEELGESIAITLQTVKNNARTAELLEETKKQSEEMAAQEEEMRQNLEELRATQEEAFRKEAESSSLITAIDATLLRVDFSPEGEIEYVNKNFLQLLDLRADAVLGEPINSIFQPENDSEFFEKWDELQDSQQAFKAKVFVISNGIQLAIDALFAGISDIDGYVVRVTLIAYTSENRT
jgi:PAS domain-containing protein